MMDDRLGACRCVVTKRGSAVRRQGCCMGPPVQAVKGLRQRPESHLPHLSPSTGDKRTKESRDDTLRSIYDIGSGQPKTERHPVRSKPKWGGMPRTSPAVIAGAVSDKLGEKTLELDSWISDGSDISSASSALLPSLGETRGSPDSTNSFPIETFPIVDTLWETSGGQLTRLGAVERTLCESWKELPWQARLCPRAIENQEDIRRACAWDKEDHRVRAWRRGQQKKALCVARLEDEHLSDWWKAEGENMMELEAKRRRDHIQLAESHERLLAELEHERTTSLRVGYEQELATLDRMDSSWYAERHRQMESLFEAFSAGLKSTFALETSHTHPGASDPVVRGALPGRDERSRTRTNEAGIAQMSAERDAELEHGAQYVPVAEEALRVSGRRQHLVHLIFRGLAAMYHSARGRARRTFVSECAADLGRVKGLCTSGKDILSEQPGGASERATIKDDDHTCPAVRWERERCRAIAEIDKEVSTAAQWARLQRAVHRKSTGEVLRLLTIDSLRQDPVDRVGRGSDLLASIDTVRRRARRTLSELRTWQAEAYVEVERVRRSWMAALAHWDAQLGHAKIAAAREEAGELRVIQEEEEKALAAREGEVICALEKRRQTLAQSFVDMIELERGSINDASLAWRYCYLSAWDKLVELYEVAGREYNRVEDFWEEQAEAAKQIAVFGAFEKIVRFCLHVENSSKTFSPSSNPTVRTKWAVELDSLRKPVEGIDEEKRRLEEQQSSLLFANLAGTVVEHFEAEGDAVVSGGRLWWEEAREGLLKLYSATEKASYRGNPLGSTFDANAVRSAPTSVGTSNDMGALASSLDEMARAEEARSTAATAAIVAENGPLHRAVAEQHRRCKETMERCLSDLNAATELRNPYPSDDELEAIEDAAEDHRGGSASHPKVSAGLHRFRSQLEKEAVARATASFEDEIRQLVVEAREETAPSLSDCPSELTRSTLDLRRAARVGTYARDLGRMLFRAHDAVIKMKRDAMEAKERELDLNSDVLTSRQRLRIIDIEKNAKENSDGALKVAMDQADNRARSISISLRTSSGKRRRLMQLAAGWLERVKQYERGRSTRRLQQRAERDKAWKTSLAELNFDLSLQQQVCAHRVRKGGEEALKGARVVVSKLVDERIRWKREGDPHLANSLSDGGAVNRVDSTSTAASTEVSGGKAQGVGRLAPGAQSVEGDKNIRDGPPNNAGGTKLIATINLIGDEITGPASLRPNPSTLGEDIAIDASAMLAAAEASLLVSVNSWGRDTEWKARNWANKILSDATRTKAEEMQTADSESKTLRSAFRDAEGAAVQAFSDNWRDTPTVAAENFRNAAEARNDATRQDDADAECLPAFVAVERQECARLWFALEQALESRLLDVAQRAGSEFLEDAKELGEGVMAYVENLKSALRDVLEETKANGRSELEVIVTRSMAKLKSVSALIDKQLAAAREEEEAAGRSRGRAIIRRIGSRRG